MDLIEKIRHAAHANDTRHISEIASVALLGLNEHASHRALAHLYPAEIEDAYAYLCGAITPALLDDAVEELAVYRDVLGYHSVGHRLTPMPVPVFEAAMVEAAPAAIKRIEEVMEEHRGLFPFIPFINAASDYRASVEEAEEIEASSPDTSAYSNTTHRVGLLTNFIREAQPARPWAGWATWPGYDQEKLTNAAYKVVALAARSIIVERALLDAMNPRWAS